jgi:hypothetical protein
MELSVGIVRVANGPQSQFYINALEEGGVVSEVAACLLLDCSIALLVLYLSTTVKFSAFLPFLGSWGSRLKLFVYSRKRLALVLANLLADRSKIAFSKSSYISIISLQVNFYVRKTFRSICKKYDKITISYTSIIMKPLSYMYSIIM